MSADRYAVSSRVRFARNLNYPFPDRLSETGDMKTRKARNHSIQNDLWLLLFNPLSL